MYILSQDLFIGQQQEDSTPGTCNEDINGNSASPSFLRKVAGFLSSKKRNTTRKDTSSSITETEINEDFNVNDNGDNSFATPEDDTSFKDTSTLEKDVTVVHRVACSNSARMKMQGNNDS